MARLEITAITVIATLISSSCQGGASDNLAAGACFDVPPGNSSATANVRPLSCTEPHDAEVVFVGDFTPATDAYPSEADITDFESDTCIAAFDAYVGFDFLEDELYDLDSLPPTAEGWSDGDRQIACYARRLDGAKLTTSIKKPSGRATPWSRPRTASRGASAP